MAHPSDIALSHIKKLLARDPMLRDVLSEAIPGMGNVGPFSPDVDVVETGAAHVILADLPGVPKDRVRVRLEGARLLIEGERPAPRVDGGAVRSSERSYGPFKREFLLPTDVTAEGVSAHFDEGVLTVTVPRARPADGAGVDVPVS